MRLRWAAHRTGGRSRYDIRLRIHEKQEPSSTPAGTRKPAPRSAPGRAAPHRPAHQQQARRALQRRALDVLPGRAGSRAGATALETRDRGSAARRGLERARRQVGEREFPAWPSAFRGDGYHRDPQQPVWHRRRPARDYKRAGRRSRDAVMFGRKALRTELTPAGLWIGRSSWAETASPTSGIDWRASAGALTVTAQVYVNRLMPLVNDGLIGPTALFRIQAVRFAPGVRISLVAARIPKRDDRRVIPIASSRGGARCRRESRPHAARLPRKSGETRRSTKTRS